MMRKLTIYCSLVLLFLSACETKFYKKFEGIALGQWKRSEPIRFEIDIENTEAKYQIFSAFRYSANVKHLAIKFELSIQTPSGNKTTQKHIVAIKDTKGNQLGEAMGDIADIESVIMEEFAFAEKGKYVFTITQMMPPEEVGGIYEVGLIVDKI